MSKWLVAVALVALPLSTVGRAQFGRGAPPVRPVAGHGVNVPGWWARMDTPTASGSLMLTSESATVLHARTGPAAIFWDPRESASGEYTVTAKFTVRRMPTFEEGYGLFIGGQHLDQDNERYTAFLAREDGEYAIRERRGATNSSGAAAVNWMTSPALTRPDASNRVVNALAIHVGRDAVTFMANGTQVAMRPVSAIDTNGIVGLRVNNNLDVQIEGFTIEKGK